MMMGKKEAWAENGKTFLDAKSHSLISGERYDTITYIYVMVINFISVVIYRKTSNNACNLIPGLQHLATKPKFGNRIAPIIRGFRAR